MGVWVGGSVCRSVGDGIIVTLGIGVSVNITIGNAVGISDGAGEIACAVEAGSSLGVKIGRTVSSAREHAATSPIMVNHTTQYRPFFLLTTFLYRASWPVDSPSSAPRSYHSPLALHSWARRKSPVRGRRCHLPDYKPIDARDR